MGFNLFNPIDSNLSAQIEEGQVSRISILRGSCEFGMSIIGGCDTPLVGCANTHSNITTPFHRISVDT